MVLSLDTEDTGVDFHKGARPFYVSTCNERGDVQCWCWEVDPLTRQPHIPKQDVQAIRNLLTVTAKWQGTEHEDQHRLVGQNFKFDASALSFIGVDNFPWPMVEDTLVAGHLLASNLPHDLTSMVLQYLGEDIEHYEDDLERCVQECRTWCRSHKPDWAIAKQGRKDMPSAKEKTWRYDYWLPRAVALDQGYLRGTCEVVNKRTDQFDVYIGRPSKWGNPFEIGRDGNREQVIEKYRRWIRGKPLLLAALGELDGKRLGCQDEDCHGDILVGLLAERGHEYWTVLEKYAQADAVYTVALWPVLKAEIERRGLWKIYRESMRVPSILERMGAGGMTYNRKRAQQLLVQYRNEAEECRTKCVSLADGDIEDLPVSGRSHALDNIILNKFKLKSTKTTKNGNISLDKDVLENWYLTLPRTNKAWHFISNLRAYRKRQTAIGFIESYEKFCLPHSSGDDEWAVLYPSVNLTGTDTTRMSSSTPNGQQIGRRAIEEMREEGGKGHSARWMFGPAPSRHWYSMDYENQELRLPAYESGEPELIDLFERRNDPPYYGSEHLLNFSVIYATEWEAALRSAVWEWDGPDKGKRIDITLVGPYCKKKYETTLYKSCKCGDFALGYQCGRKRADATFGREGSYDKLQARFSRKSALNRRWVSYAKKHGYVETMPDKSVDPDHGYPLLCKVYDSGGVVPTTPLSYRVQGTGGWCIRKAMIRCQPRLDEWSEPDWVYRMVLPVHDELIFDFPERDDDKARELRAIMEVSGQDVGVPLTVAVTYHANSWEDGEDI